MNCESKLSKIKDIVSDEATGDLSIVVLHRGWVFVGELSDSKSGGLRLGNVRNVRKWDSGGFGRLTRGAKSSGAVLDAAQPMEFYADAMIFSAALPEGWDNA
jgi:hypothetical protein